MDTDEVYNEHLILATKVRRRNKLQFQLALLGPTADPSISIQIEDLEKEIVRSSQKLDIKPEGIFIDTSVNLKDRRILLLQVTYDISNIIMESFEECIRVLLELDEAKTSKKDDEVIDEIKRKSVEKEDKLWKECSSLTAIFRENRLLFPKKADLAITSFVKKVFRFVNFDWFIEENLKDAVIEWDDYISKAQRSIVDVMRSFIEAENKP